jgi:hypothetical protein
MYEGDAEWIRNAPRAEPDHVKGNNLLKRRRMYLADGAYNAWCDVRNVVKEIR